MQLLKLSRKSKNLLSKSSDYHTRIYIHIYIHTYTFFVCSCSSSRASPRN